MKEEIHAVGEVLTQYGKEFGLLVEGKHECRGIMSGKMIKNGIRLVAGDKVKVVFCPYSFSIARIVYRL